MVWCKMGKEEKDTGTNRLGMQVRRLRLANHMSLGDLAARVDTSRSFLSQVEQGKTLPSLTTLKTIADALDVTVGSLIDEPSHNRSPVIRSADRPRIAHLQAGMTIEALTDRDIHKVMQPVLFKLQPGATSGNEGYAHQGQEFGFVVKGTLQVEVGGVEYQLEEGDSIYYDCSRAHRFWNSGDEEALAVWVVTPPTF